MSQLIDLRHDSDPRDVIHRVVHLLAEGELVAFPTETYYLVAAHALQPLAVQRLRELNGNAVNEPLPLALKSPAELLDYVPDLSPLGWKLARRCWPGPLTLAVDAPTHSGLLDSLPDEVRRAVVVEGEVRFRVAAHDVLHEVLRLSPAPLVLMNERADGCRTAADAQQSWGSHVAMIIDDGPGRYPQPSTLVRVRGERWEIAEPGVVTETVLRRLSGNVFLFVCTGNTCRSPMAEGMFRRMLAERLGCADDELADHGFIVLSAGLSAAAGAPAAPEAVDLFRDRGIDLRAHASQPLTDRLLDQADHVLTMTRNHRDAILNSRPDVADRLNLLSRNDCDISDPIGGSLRDYDECQQEIERHLRAILDDLELTGGQKP